MREKGHVEEQPGEEKEGKREKRGGKRINDGGRGRNTMREECCKGEGVEGRGSRKCHTTGTTCKVDDPVTLNANP